MKEAKTGKQGTIVLKLYLEKNFKKVKNLSFIFKVKTTATLFRKIMYSFMTIELSASAINPISQHHHLPLVER